MSTPPPPAEPTVTLSLDEAFALARQHHAAGRLPQAERLYLRVLEAMPAHPGALYLLGVMATQVGRFAHAENRFRAVLRLRPDNVEAWAGLSGVLHEQGQFAEAERAARRAVESNGRSALGHAALGRVLLNRSRHGEATAAYRKAVELAPRDPELLTSLLYCMTQDESVDPQALAAMHRQFGRRFGANLADRVREHANDRDPQRRLRVGFVSADLRQHAVAYFIEPLWRALDRRQVELFAYSNLAIEDAASARLKECVDHWSAVASLDDAQLTRKIVGDAIDILFDLSGHTVGNRLLTFARKPAPVQVTWIGYPETTGLTAMDYYLADRFTAPPGAVDELYVERLVRLPAGPGFRPDPEAPDVNPLPALQRGHVTFGSFNRLSKIGGTVFETWARILVAVPGSRMVLANVGDDEVRRDIETRFATHGVSAERLSFVPRMSLPDYLRLHHEVDLLLDTFPYTGGTTTQHATWMGVPVVTLAGRRRSERISTANLSRIGLADWSVDSIDDYVARAVRAAGDLPGLAVLRAGLRERIATNPLRQPTTAARGLEIALRTMWQRWCEGLPPESFEVGLDQALQASPA